MSGFGGFFGSENVLFEEALLHELFQVLLDGPEWMVLSLTVMV